jgi:hypothetical protein
MPSSLVYPMFAMVLLSATVLVIMFRSRVRAVREGAISKTYFLLYQGATEPDSIAKPARHFRNLFEAPTLFYAACLAAMVTHQTGWLVVVLAWAYVVARVVHAFIHLGSNRLRYRVRAYGVSWLVLLALWIVIVTGVSGVAA